MKVLLLTDVPPCHQFTGGMVLNSMVSFMPIDQVALCAVVNPILKFDIPPELHGIPKLILKKPRELSYRIFDNVLGKISAFLFELVQGLNVRYKLLPQIADFAKKHQVDALWVVIEGQTMLRLSKGLSEKLSIPLFPQIWDPFELWLRSNGIDRWTQRRLLAEFDKVIAHSTSCATASWRMSEAYNEKYGVKNQPVIAGLAKELARKPAIAIHDRGDFIIGIAGQIYSEDEWHFLIEALNKVNWNIANRQIRLRVLSGGFQSYTQKPANFEYLGWQSQEDTLRILADCDLLYLPYWFAEEFRKESTYCFPSKLVTYFASGRPVFCHAPDYSSPAQYLLQNDAGYICTALDSQTIVNSIENIIMDTKTYARIAQNGAACFLRDFTLESMRESFFQFLDYSAASNAK